MSLLHKLLGAPRGTHCSVFLCSFMISALGEAAQQRDPTPPAQTHRFPRTRRQRTGARGRSASVRPPCAVFKMAQGRFTSSGDLALYLSERRSTAPHRPLPSELHCWRGQPAASAGAALPVRRPFSSFTSRAESPRPRSPLSSALHPPRLRCSPFRPSSSGGGGVDLFPHRDSSRLKMQAKTPPKEAWMVRTHESR